MSLRVEPSRVEPDIVVFHLYGNLIFGPEADALETNVRDLVNHGDKRIIFELSGVERIDSVGGMELVRCFLVAREAGGGLRVACPSRCVQRLFKNVQLESLIPLFPNVAAACENFTTGEAKQA